jgi:hypothetical protein
MSDRVYGGSHLEWAEYFYALATRQEEDVPEAAFRHVRGCPSCRKRVVRLRETVSRIHDGADEQGFSANRATIGTLDAHFQCLDKQVACSRVRPFLPGLLDSSLDLRIPTPLTVHVDQCPQCAGDLRLLRELNLSDEQLRRLRRLYEHKPAGGLLLCRRARSRIAAFVRGAWRDMDGETLSHLSACPRCRADVYVCRQNLLDDLTETQGDSCDRIVPADLFDHVVPHADMVGNMELSSVASPTATSRKGLEMMQAMHRVIYGIAERGDSGVTTLYRLAEKDRALDAGPDDLDAGYPITVEVVHGGPQRAPSCGQATLQGAAVNPRVRRILKTMAVAAAVILLTALFYYTQGSSGTTMARVARAFGQARNVRVVSLSPQGDRVVYELWVSRELNLTGMLTPQGCVVYDLQRREKEDVVSGDVTPVGGFELTNVQEMGDHCLGFSLAGVPADAKWERIDGDSSREVHEFTWMRQTDRGRDVPTKYEVTIDTSTMLPVSLRLFRMESPGTGWECQSLIVFEYPTADRMRSVMVCKPLGGVDNQR